MQANEFEKNVQQVMGEFKISPSAGVWAAVEGRIQERKKKRRILFLIAVSFIGLSLAGYGIYSSSHRQPNAGNEFVSKKKINNNDDNATKPTLVHQDSAPDANKGGAESLANTKQHNDEIVKANTTIAGSQKEIIVTERFLTTSGLLDQNQPPGENFANDKGKSIAITDNKLSPNETNRLTVGLNQKMQADPANKNISITTFIDTALVKVLQANSAQQNQKKPADRVSNKLQWGVNFSAGTSIITDNHFSFKNVAALADISYSSPGTSATGGGARFPASSNESVFGFKAGIVVKKEISLRSQLSAGLQYAYLGDHIKASTASTQAGSQQGSSSNLLSYYTAVPQKTYEDRFHFIELPILYHWRMSKNDKHFLSLNAGASAGYLLGSNALIYDTTYRGIYFHDESLLTKTHFNLISGVSYHFAGANSFEWSIGPQFSFDLSRIIKSEVDKRRYLLYAGIDTRVFFEKKKNK